jgi:hypothetical protein
VVLHCPTHDAATERIDHHGQVQEASPSGNDGVIIVCFDPISRSHSHNEFTLMKIPPSETNDLFAHPERASLIPIAYRSPVQSPPVVSHSHHRRRGAAHVLARPGGRRGSLWRATRGIRRALG